MAPEKNGKSGDYLRLFTNLSFMLLWTGQLISYLGDRLDQMTLLQMASEKTDRLAPVMTYTGFFILLPFVLLAPWAGPAADRYSRKMILVVTSLCQGLIILGVPFVRESRPVQAHLVGMIYLVTFLIGSFTIFFYTAKTALIPQIVGEAELMAANSLCSFAGTLMTLVGTFVASALLRLIALGIFDLSIMFYIDAATYFISGAMFLGIAIRPGAAIVPPPARETFGRKIREGLRYVRSHRRVLKLIALSMAVYFSAGLVFAMVNGAVLDALRWPVEKYALAVGILGVGMLVGAVATTLFRRRIRSLELFVAGCFGTAAVASLPLAGWGKVGAMGLSFPALLGKVLAPPLFIIGACGGGLIVLAVTLLQRWVPRRYHGRIFALNSMCDVTVQLAAIGFGGFLLSRGLWRMSVGLTFAFLLAAAMGALFSGERSRHKVVRSAVRLFLALYCRARYEGRENVPRRGALIVASNHTSWLDTLFVGAAVPRLIHFMAAREFYDLWYLKWIMKAFGTIPLERGKGQRRPLRLAIATLRRGRVIGVFPEGRMSLDGDFQPLQGGVALLASETGAPILPVAIVGGFEVMGPDKSFPRPRKVHVRIGAPIKTVGVERAEIMRRLNSAIRALIEPRR